MTAMGGKVSSGIQVSPQGNSKFPLVNRMELDGQIVQQTHTDIVANRCPMSVWVIGRSAWGTMHEHEAGPPGLPLAQS